VPTGISPDGEWLLFYEQHPETSRDVWVLRLDGSGDGQRFVMVRAHEQANRIHVVLDWLAELERLNAGGSR
jgi:hypothetical protein